MSATDLEPGSAEDYAWFLAEWIIETKESGDTEDIAAIRKLWDDNYDWEDILEKAAAEGSTWYVWWMDGVRAYMLKEAEINVG